MIFSDFFGDLDELESALHRMRYNKHEVVLFQIMHHDEIAFEFDGMIKFIGLEVPDELLAQTDDLRRGYLNAVAQFNDRARANRRPQRLRTGAGRHQPRHGRAVHRLS